MLDASIPGRYDLEIVDLARHPERAEKDSVIAAPTVVRVSPAPQRRAIGELSDAAAVCSALALPNGAKRLA